MSEERLQEIKDSLNAQYEIAKSDNKYQSVYVVLDEEQELIEEIERLNNIINKAIEFIEKYQIERKVKIGNVELDKSFVNSQGVLDILKGEDKE